MGQALRKPVPTFLTDPLRTKPVIDSISTGIISSYKVSTYGRHMTSLRDFFNLALPYLTGKKPKHEGHYGHKGCKEGI